VDQPVNPCSVTPVEPMNLLSYCALILLLGLSIGMFFKLFRRVYGAGGDTVQVAFYSWVDLVLASFVVLLIISQILASTAAPDQALPENIDTRTMVLSVLTWWGLILGPILVSLRFRGLKLGSVFGVDRMPVGRSLLLGVSLLVSALPLVFAVDYLASTLLRVNSTTDTQEVIRIFENATTAAQRIPIILLAVVIAPVAEELAFRGYLYGVIKRYFGPVPALVLTGILFALIHLNLPSFFPLLVLASVLALSYELSGTLLVPMAMHALFNSLSLVLVLVEQK
jgi:membrane protease YdiL (CAAX protease family)